jgi:hypothetical protein
MLKPLKGNFAGYISLDDAVFCRNEQNRLVLRFSIAIANVGKTDLRIVLGDPETLGDRVVARAKQIIRHQDNTVKEIDVGYFEKYVEQLPDGHSHTHWHYKDLASLDLVDREGKVVASSDKPGYCVIDSFPHPDFPDHKDRQFIHEGCEKKTERGLGITAGWCDYYHYDTDLQYIDVDDVPPGQYTLRFTINRREIEYIVEEPATKEITITDQDKLVTAKCVDVF